MRIAAALIVFGLLAAMSGAARAAVFYPSHFTLANGLQVVVVPNHLAPVVSQMVWYRVGSADEPLGKSGLAHYLEHLMFRGTEVVPPGEFSKIVAGQGGQDNAFTSYDYTAYHEEVEVSRLPMIMQLEADRMQNLRLVKETAEPELRVISDERQQRTDNSPEGRFIEKLKTTFMPGYPYGRPVIGWKKEIDKLTVTDARKFYEAHYAPNNAMVIVSGDVRVEDVISLAAATYGRIPKRDVPERRTFGSFAQTKTRHVTVKDARVEQPEVVWHIAAPSYIKAAGNEAYATEVLAEVLDGGEVGLLYPKLVKELGLATGVETHYDPSSRGDAEFVIGVSLREAKAAQKIESALRATLADLARQGIDPSRVEDAKNRLQRLATFAREGLMMPGYVFGTAFATGGTVAEAEAWPDRINAVTVEDVNAALHRLIAEKRQIVGSLLPSPRAKNARGAR